MKTSIIILIFVSFVDTVQSGIARNLMGNSRLSMRTETPSQGASTEGPALLELLTRPASTDLCPPRIGCRMECPEGFLKDKQGCEICRCNSESFKRGPCPQSKRGCSNECAYGQALDKRGCATCTCNPPPLGSANGNEGSGSVNEDSASDDEDDSAGKDEGSGSVNADSASDDEDSANAIENSTGKNEDSASENEDSANNNEEHASNNEDSANEDKDHTNKKERCVNKDTCKRYCPDGFVLDFSPCVDCYCRPDPAKLQAEREAGRRKVDCSLRPACNMRCPYGYRKDSDGCDSCSCVYYKYRVFHRWNTAFHMPLGPIY